MLQRQIKPSSRRLWWNIKYLFGGSRDLRAERLCWHPDKFSRALEESRAVFQKKAKEVFVVIDAMYKKETGK
ncbi:hypothetical protein LTR37_008834 [Vermiconidia calcicola]|uniref:Uncharacterized protein n=1 Tax=Vermiconidia calcicola TaxID=1690605 RepID=A0ACC3NB58_9PEZI|nr:hypothetical protein LTR37_008834 [Vermiconidia calcicola]